MASTHFQPANARRAFPCFDEPRDKAVFNIAVIHSSGMIAIANTLEVSTVPAAGSPGWSLTTFEPTPVMPTYSVGWIVAAYIKKEVNSSTGIRVSTKIFPMLRPN